MANNLRFDLTGLTRICTELTIAALLAGFAQVTSMGEIIGVYAGRTQNNVFDYMCRLIMIVSWIASAIWIYRASWNARQIVPDPKRIGPGWAIGWFFIPIMWYWKPYQAIRQCWNSSTNPGGNIDSPAPGFLSLWWWTWCAGWILPWFALALIYMGLAKSSAVLEVLLLLSGLSALVASILFIRLIRSITKAQRDASPGLAAVFA
jgi:hypothetical protein